MRIQRVSVSKLFGIFDHVIDMRREDRVTIIIGENGIGKTTILRMLLALSNAQFGVLADIPFEQLAISFDSGEELLIAREPVTLDKPKPRRPLSTQSMRREPTALIKLTYKSADGETFAHSEDQSFDEDQLAEYLERYASDLVRIEGRRWLEHPSGNILDLEAVVKRYGRHLPSSVLKALRPEWLVQVLDGISIKLIGTDRLSPQAGRKISTSSGVQTRQIPRVDAYAEELANEIQRSLSGYAALSQSLDRSFPERVIREIQSFGLGGRQRLTIDELRDEYAALELQRQRLRGVGVLGEEDETQFSIPSDIEGTTLAILSVNVSDVKRKLAFFDDIAARIELFTSVLNDRFSYKRIVVTKDVGFTVVTAGGVVIPPSLLSSGEQHELVLVFDLLFRTKENTLVLIDEPEISLHLAWQELFLSDLVSIAKLSRFDVLLATHAPGIVYNKWHLAVELTGPDKTN